MSLEYFFTGTAEMVFSFYIFPALILPTQQQYLEGGFYKGTAVDQVQVSGCTVYTRQEHVQHANSRFGKQIQSLSPLHASREFWKAWRSSFSQSKTGSSSFLNYLLFIRRFFTSQDLDFDRKTDERWERRFFKRGMQRLGTLCVFGGHELELRERIEN